jgi:hypothetical protein
MEELARSKNTPGVDAAFDLLSRVAVDPESDERYPDGTILIPGDSSDTSALISRAITDRRPIALVFPDGSDVVARPPESGAVAVVLLLAVLWVGDRLSRKRDRPTFVPREWVTEFHAAPTGRGRELVA